MFDHHGYPRTLQSVRGKEFYGEVKTFCEKKKDRDDKKQAISSSITRKSRTITYVFKGCVRYIFTSLFCMP